MRSGHVALAGRPNAGKSSLLNLLVGEHLALVSPKAQATRLPVVGLRTEGDTQFVFHDLPGLLEPSYPLQERMRALALEGAERADVILHLHPAPDAPAPSFAEAAGLPGPPKAPVILVHTQCDLVPSAARATLAASGVMTSAVTGEGVTELLERVRELLPERDHAYPQDDLGTQPLRFFAAEFLREAAFEHLEDELPYAFAAEIEEFRESTDPVYIRANLFIERESQKRILVGKGGATLKMIGQHARRRLEALLGRRVYLDTWVQVLPRWRRDPVQLRRFGFPDAP
ncbi:MAG: GTPase Era [Gemmatimonadales bacterium]